MEGLNEVKSWTIRELKASNVFEPRIATGSEHFGRQIFKLIVSTGEKRLNNINVVVWRQVE